MEISDAEGTTYEEANMARKAKAKAKAIKIAKTENTQG